MDVYLLLRLGHVAGFILLGGGLAAVFLADWRGRQASDARGFADSARHVALFYDGLVFPGALLLAVSGLALLFELGLAFFEAPWLVAMWGLFLFEFIEGNSITRVVYRRTVKQAEDALRSGASARTGSATQSLIGRFTHFLDLPLFAVIVYCGVVRPESWRPVVLAVLIAVAIAAGLTVATRGVAAPTPPVRRAWRGSRRTRRPRLRWTRCPRTEPDRDGHPVEKEQRDKGHTAFLDLWFEKDMESGLEFHASPIPGSAVHRVMPVPADTPSGPPGSVKVAGFTLGDQRYMAIEAGPLDPFNHSFSILVECDTQEEIDRLWDTLKEGGQVEQCGWLRDRWDLSWQIAPKCLGELMHDPDRAKPRRVAKAMLKMVKLDIAGPEAAARE